MATRTIYEYTCDCCGKTISSSREKPDCLTNVQVPVRHDDPADYYRFSITYKKEDIEVCPDCLDEMKRYFLKEYNFESTYNNRVRRVKD